MLTLSQIQICIAKEGAKCLLSKSLHSSASKNSAKFGQMQRTKQGQGPSYDNSCVQLLNELHCIDYLEQFRATDARLCCWAGWPLKKCLVVLPQKILTKLFDTNVRQNLSIWKIVPCHFVRPKIPILCYLSVMCEHPLNLFMCRGF